MRGLSHRLDLPAKCDRERLRDLLPDRWKLAGHPRRLLSAVAGVAGRRPVSTKPEPQEPRDPRKLRLGDSVGRSDARR